VGCGSAKSNSASAAAACTSKDAAATKPDTYAHAALGHAHTSAAIAAGKEGEGAQASARGAASGTCVKWVKEATTVLNKVRNNKKAWPFLQAVHPVQDECLDYFEIIERPRDLGTIASKLAASEYSNAQALLLDMLLAFDNAQVYNPPENQVFKLAKEMRGVVATACASSPYLKGPLALACDELHHYKQANASRVGQDADTAGPSGQALQKEMAAARDAMNTPQFKTVERDLAGLVVAGARTSMAKVSQAALDKVSRHQSGKLLKISEPLSHKDLVALVHVLKTNCSTQRLDLDGCGIGDEGCKLLRDLLVANKRISELDLQWNQISDDGAKLLAEGVAESGLSELHVANNIITLPGARALVQAAREHLVLCARPLKISGISDVVLAAVHKDLAAPQTNAQSPFKRPAAAKSPARSHKTPQTTSDSLLDAVPTDVAPSKKSTSQAHHATPLDEDQKSSKSPEVRFEKSPEKSTEKSPVKSPEKSCSMRSPGKFLAKSLVKSQKSPQKSTQKNQTSLQKSFQKGQKSPASNSTEGSRCGEDHSSKPSAMGSSAAAPMQID